MCECSSNFERAEYNFYCVNQIKKKNIELIPLLSHAFYYPFLSWTVSFGLSDIARLQTNSLFKLIPKYYNNLKVYFLFYFISFTRSEYFSHD